MYSIQNITDNPLQTMSVVLPDGSSFSWTIQFKPMQYGWFILSLAYGTFTMNGIRLCNSPNLLHQWRNQIPFGLALFSNGDREPTQQEDFASGATSVYLLTQAETLEYANFLTGA